MTNQPICDDPGATDDRGSREGQLGSHEVKIRFSPITRDRMEIEISKWWQTTWQVKPLRKTCILTYFGHDLTLTWVQILKLIFRGQKVFRNGSTRHTWLSNFHIAYIKKVISDKLSRWKIDFMTSGDKTVDHRSNLLEKSWQEEFLTLF